MEKFYVDVCLIDSAMDKHGFEFESVSDAVCYISEGIEFLTRHFEEPSFYDECRSWIDDMREAVDCIDVYV